MALASARGRLGKSLRTFARRPTRLRRAVEEGHSLSGCFPADFGELSRTEPDSASPGSSIVSPWQFIGNACGRQSHASKNPTMGSQTGHYLRKSLMNKEY